MSFAIKFYSLLVRTLSILILKFPSQNFKVKHWQKSQKSFSFSQIPPKNKRLRIWFHCASWGEFAKIQLLAEELTSDFEIFVTFFSVSGILSLEDIRRTKPESILGFQQNIANLQKVNFLLLPPDTKSNSEKLISKILPSFVVWTESEIWLNYSLELEKRKIQQIVLCGKLKSKSFKLNPIVKPLFKQLYNQAKSISALDENSAQNFAKLGVEKSKISTLDDLKIEKLLRLKKNSIPKVWQELKKEKKIFVFGSLHKSDWNIFKKAILELQEKFYLILVPHEPKDLSFLQEIITNLKLSDSQILSKTKSLSKNLILIDRVGLLQQILSISDLAYIGGGFEPKGIHSILEAKIFQVPTFFGTNFQNSTEVLEEDEKFVVSTSEEFLEKIEKIGNSHPNYKIPQSNFKKIKNIILEAAKLTS
ncbi:MAG: hypothetical protein DWQ06_02975 [Calditrichaeota bacterium]|nr:MAG: hypothetical protein DWQ06_02975 [Calditrichota bacterium]